MLLSCTPHSRKLRFTLEILRYAVYTVFYLMCLRLLLVQFIGLGFSNRLLAGAIGVAIAALAWRRSDWAILGFVASVPFISGLQIHFSLSSKPLFELIFSALFVAWFTRRLLRDKLPLSQISPVSGIVDVLAGATMISLVAVCSHYPIDLLIDKLKSDSYYTLNDPLWCLGAGYLLLQGLFIYRIMEMEIDAAAMIKSAGRIFLIHAFLIIPFSLYQYILKSPRLFYSNYGVYLPFDDAHSYGSYVLFLFLYSLLFCFRQEAKNRFKYGVLPIILLCLIVLSGSRATWVALGIAGTGYLFFHLPKKYFPLVVAAFAGVLIVINLLPQNAARWQNPYLERLGSLAFIEKLPEDKALNMRSVLWHRAFNIGREFPFSGTGIGTFYRTSTFFHDPDDAFLSDLHENTHNYYLQMAVELGIPATFLFILILYYTYRAAWKVRHANGSYKYLVEGSIVGLSGYLITLITGHALLIAKQQVLFWFVIAAIMIPIYKTGTADDSTSQGGIAKFLLYGLVVLSIGAQIFQFFNVTPKPWTREYGFYDYEDWQGEKMRWTWQRAIDSIVPDNNLVGFKMVAFPQNSEGPEGLTVRVTLDGKPWDEIHIFDGGVRPLYYLLPGVKDRRVELGLEVSRTFNPRKMGLNEDNRNLGVAVSPITSLKIMPLEGIGFYAPQTWDGEPWQGWPVDVPLNYRWSGKRATLNLSREQLKDVRIFFKCTHPDIRQNFVTVSIEQGGSTLRHLVFRDNTAKMLEITPEELIGSGFLTILVDRTWNLRGVGISDDDRDLGVAVAILKN